MKEKKIKKSTKTILWIISCVFSMFTILSIILFLGAQNRTTVKIEGVEGNIYLYRIKIGETFYQIKDFEKYSGLELLNDDNETHNDELLVFQKNKSLIFNISDYHNLYLSFATDISRGKISISVGDDKVERTLTNESDDFTYSYTSSMYNVINKTLSNLNIYIRIFLGELLLLFIVIYYFVLKKILSILYKIKNENSLPIKHIIFLFCSYVIINLNVSLPLLEFLNKWFVIVILMQIVALSIWLKFYKNQKLQNIFALFSIIFVVNMAIILPPFHVPDEYSHYIKAYSLFNSKDMVSDNQIKIYDTVHKSSSKYTLYTLDYEYKTTFKEYYADMGIFLEGKKEIIHSFYNTAYINPFAYVPSAIMLELCEILHLPFIFHSIFARLVNALIFVILGFISLKIIPYCKRLLFIVMLFPITIQQVTAINQDSITLSIIFIFIAYVFKLIFSKEKISKSKYLVLLLLASCIGVSKPGYFPVTLLVFLIPNRNFSSKKVAYVCKSLPFIMCTLLTTLKYSATDTTVSYPNVVTMDYILKNPLFVVKIFFNTFYESGAYNLFTGQINLFGWSTIFYDFSLSTLIYSLYFMIFFINNDDPFKKDYKKKIFIFLLALIILGIIYGSALVGFKTTYITSKTISGLQARYFIPVTLLILLSLSTDFIKTKEKSSDNLTLTVILFTIIISFYTIISGFFL